LDLSRFYKLANYEIGDCSSNQILGLPHIDISSVYEKVQSNYYGRFDKHNIPTFNLGKKISPNNIDSNYSYHLIALYALATASKYIKINSEKHKAEFLNIIDWILEKRFEVDGTICWKQNFDNASYGLKAPWSSCLIQGRMLSNLSRAYQFTNHPKYLDYAYKVFKFLLVDVSNGGLKACDSYGNLWFEEYPSKKPSFVLNGFIFTLFGLHDYYRVARKEEVNDCINECTKTVRNSLHLYDNGYWTIYDQYWKSLTSFHYHMDIHLLQIKALYKMTNDPLFQKFYFQWKRYSKNISSKLVWTLWFPISGIKKSMLTKLQFPD
jgi:heparosan-N-sulfate-glucuronate 5-epimerase